jgi:hypothetical protein
MQTLTKVLPATAPTREPLVGSERGGKCDGRLGAGAPSRQQGHGQKPRHRADALNAQWPCKGGQ